MNCERVRPYLTAHAAGELPAHTASWVNPHVEDCPVCSSLSLRHATIRVALRTLPEATVDPPPGFAATVARRAARLKRARPIPIPPMIPPDAIRVLTDNRDAILGSAGVALGAAGVAWIAWRSMRSRKPGPRTA
ncbi:MAG TPA: zf-HC2 domain-containing protein [Actinomycetota bacterium]|nr:zf-HC2 domain-containing protein [Actinomycetota bacterium]